MLGWVKARREGWRGVFCKKFSVNLSFRLPDPLQCFSEVVDVLFQRAASFIHCDIRAITVLETAKLMSSQKSLLVLALALDVNVS